MSWIPLHVHSQYSILDGTASVAALASHAKKNGFSSLALTDLGNLHGAVDFFKACKAEGLKAILGCELMVAPGSRFEKKRTPGVPYAYPLILIAKNKVGYRNLCKLSSIGYLEGFYYTPRIDREVLALYSEGLICLSGPLNAHIPSLILQGKEAELLSEIAWYKDLFKEDYYFELQRHVMKEEDIFADGLNKEGWAYQNYLDCIANQEKVIARFKELSLELGVPCVATNDTHYLEREDWRAHEILMNVQSGEPCEIWEKDSFGNLKSKVKNPKRQTTPSHELYFKTEAQMQELFADVKEAVATAFLIAEKCNLELDFKTKYYPLYVPPHLEGIPLSKEELTKEAAAYLALLCNEGLEKRYTEDKLAKVQEKYPDKDPLQVVKDRLAYELNLITSKGMCDYLLIVYDFINWAKRQGIPMGPGRGSGAGSIILYLIEITDIEPLRFNLFFERFINPERLSYPDIDVDICMERRSEVIDYTVRKYGKDKVAQIITFGTMKAKMAIKDVGRVLSVPLTKVNMLTKLVPEDPTMTLEKAFELDPELNQMYESDDEVRTIIDIAKKLEGSIRNTGIHAAGLIIGAEPIIDLIPICVAKDSDMVVTQYSMKPVEAVGMLKIDFLGLKTLTAIQKAADSVKQNYGNAIDWVNLPLDNKMTFSLLNQGKTMGIFQLESTGMQELAKQLHIDKFEEIIAVGALYRPGPMEMIPSFINRKHKREAIENDHPLMKDVLAETYGIMVYQEQVMQIASLLASYSLGEGDVLRRAMGKKDKEEMSKQREKFKNGALEKGIEPEISMHIFDKIEKFASYGFNKSHAAAYGFLSYVTAFFKSNYPKEWMSALMTVDREDITKVAKVIREAKTMGIAILPPDVNESGKEFGATPKGIRFALTAIKGVGEGVVDAIIQERTKKGPFVSLYDFFERLDTKKVGKKVVELLIYAGGFDFTLWTRQELVESVDPMYEAALQEHQEKEKGILSLFSLLEKEDKRFTAPPKIKQKMLKAEILKRENELLGFYLSGHPLDEVKSQLQKLSCVPLGQLIDLEQGAVFRAAFIIETIGIRVSAKSQKKFAILTINDGVERFELPVWPELYEEKHDLLSENQLLYGVLQLDRVEGVIKLQCRWLADLMKIDEKTIQECDLAYDKAKFQAKLAQDREKRAAGQPPKKPKEEAPKEEKMKTLVVKIDMGKVRMSHFLKIKEIFRKSPGKTPIHIEFYLGDSRKNFIAIPPDWGVEWSLKLEKELKEIASLESATTE